jgi:hypothetical protein
LVSLKLVFGCLGFHLVLKIQQDIHQAAIEDDDHKVLQWLITFDLGCNFCCLGRAKLNGFIPKATKLEGAYPSNKFRHQENVPSPSVQFGPNLNTLNLTV